MSRRSSTTATFSLKLRIPPGSSANAVMDFIVRQLREGKMRPYPEPLIKLEKKETVYL